MAVALQVYLPSEKNCNFASGTGSNAAKIIDHLKKIQKAFPVSSIVSNKVDAGVLNIADAVFHSNVNIGGKKKFFRGNAFTDEFKEGRE
ncbi:MAG: hypothetical protein IPI78_18025 [Chitinophagaceae bacterium]|nr:hypothetical protein [Chitinophagaceae bacterium]